MFNKKAVNLKSSRCFFHSFGQAFHSFGQTLAKMHSILSYFFFFFDGNSLYGKEKREEERKGEEKKEKEGKEKKRKEKKREEKRRKEKKRT